MYQPFLDDVASFRRKLEQASSWDDLRMLWRQSVSPYRVASGDPMSAEYKAEILALYEKMTAASYELSNELTSTKVPPADFARGWPWMTNDLGTAAAEMAKVVQAFRVLQTFGPEVRRVVEFGSGWANLALALAQVGLDVTAVDLDEGFILRTKALARHHEVPIHTVNTDFLAAARAMSSDFDAVIFQSSFHHCIDFNDLLGLLRNKVLTPRGRVFFFSEPVFPRYTFPWGLRTDGKSLWAITCNKWCELGFDRDFFIKLLHHHGFLGTATGAIPNVIGDAWVATSAELGLAFEDWALPSRYDETFHPVRDPGQGRFTRERSVLPVPGQRRRAVLTLTNFAPFPLAAVLASGAAEQHATVEPGVETEVVLDGVRDEIPIRADIFIPDKAYGSGDMRHVGPTLRRVCFC